MAGKEGKSRGYSYLYTLMKNISINATELVQLLDRTPSGHNIMLVGEHGIGKSEILSTYFSGKGMKVVALFLGQMSDPGDLLGLPRKDEKSGRTEFMPPYWFPVDGVPVCLFLDELNRARPEILQTVMDLVLNRKLAGRSLPEGSRIVSAVNEGEKYQLTDLDPALVSRFNIYEFRPTVQEWLLWARKERLDERVVGFIEDNGNWLDKDPDVEEGSDTGLIKMPDRRAWKRVSDIVRGRRILDGFDAEIVAGIVGVRAANLFFSSLGSGSSLSGKDILYGFSNPDVRERVRSSRLHELSVVNDSLFACLETESVPAGDRKRVGENILSYFSYLSGFKKDCAAHFVACYQNPAYQGAVNFIARECPELPDAIIRYIGKIK